MPRPARGLAPTSSKLDEVPGVPPPGPTPTPPWATAGMARTSATRASPARILCFIAPPCDHVMGCLSVVCRMPEVGRLPSGRGRAASLAGPRRMLMLDSSPGVWRRTCSRTFLVAGPARRGRARGPPGVRAHGSWSLDPHGGGGVRSRTRWTVLAGALALVVGIAVPASADHKTRPHTQNIQALGHSPQPGSFLVPDGQRTVNSDIAFWGNLAFNGNYDGFRIVDVTEPGDPRLVSWTHCNGDQGDIAVWQNLLVRSWNTKRATPRDCDGQTVPAGFEGVHVFDISNPADPKLVGSLALPCGSHTLTVAGTSNNRLIVYSNNSSSSGCVDGTQVNDDPVGDFMDVIAVPLDNPAGARLIHREPLAGPADPTVRTGCHDAGVIRGSANLAVCASADTTNVFSIGGRRRGAGVRGHRPAGHQEHVLLRRGHRGQAWPVDAAPSAERGGELHHPQLQRRAAAQRPLRRGQRQLPGRDLGDRLHRPGQPGHGRLVGPAAAGADPARRRLVLLLVQQLHLRVGDHQGPQRLPRQRPAPGGCPRP